MISPLGHSLPSLRGTPADHHNIGNPGSSSPCKWRHPPESMGEGVLHSDQALWKEKQEGGKVLTVRHGEWNGSCIVEGVAIGRWPGWSVSGWWRGQHIWDLISYRAGTIWCPSLTARPSVQVGNRELRIYEGLLSSCACALPVGVDGEPRPRPSRSLRTSNPLMVFPMVPQTRGTGVAGNREHTGREWIQWMVGVGNSGGTRPSQWTGHKSPGGHGKMFIGSGRFPGFFSRLARLSGDGFWTTNSRSHPGVWRTLSRLGRPIVGPNPTQCLLQRWKVTNYIYSRYCNWVAFLCTCTFLSNFFNL